MRDDDAVLLFFLIVALGIPVALYLRGLWKSPTLKSVDGQHEKEKKQSIKEMVSHSRSGFKLILTEYQNHYVLYSPQNPSGEKITFDKS